MLEFLSVSEKVISLLTYDRICNDVSQSVEVSFFSFISFVFLLQEGRFPRVCTYRICNFSLQRTLKLPIFHVILQQHYRTCTHFAIRAVDAVERDHLSLSAARHGSVPGPGGARQGWQGQLRFVRILSPSLPSQGELDLSQLRLAAAGTRRRLTERVRRPSRPASKRKKRLIDVDSTVATARVLSLAGRRASKMLWRL